MLFVVAVSLAITCSQSRIDHQDTLRIPPRNAADLQLLVDEESAGPALRVILPGHPESDRTIAILLPEHVTAAKRGQTTGRQLYVFRPGRTGQRPVWRRKATSLEYERDLPDSVHLLARATLDSDGVRILYEFTNLSGVAFDMITAVTDPRLTGMFHDERLERTYVHHANGFELLASETPQRLTMLRDRWLPARYLASYSWPVPAQRVERRDDGITYYNKSRAVDDAFIATLSRDSSWVVASFARDAGNVWSNPELTCQHVHQQTVLAPHGKARLEMKLLVLRGTLTDALNRARKQRSELH